MDEPRRGQEADVVMRETSLVCHELLLRLAGTLPDRFLWRYRDWLAGDAADVLARSLPRTLVRERIGLSDTEQQRLSAALLPLGADPAVVNAILPERAPAPEYMFTAEPPVGAKAGESETLVLGATLRDRHGVREVRSTWRRDDHGNAKRVVLVTASTDAVELTGEIQRVLRALGEEEPLVEVLPPTVELTGYHRAALNQSTLVCTGAEELAGHR